MTKRELLWKKVKTIINKTKWTDSSLSALAKTALDCDECPANSQECPFVKSCSETIFDWLYEHGDEEVEGSPDKEIVFITVSEPKKERIIPEGEPIKDIGAEGALGKEGKTSCDAGEYKNRFEIADKVLTETRAKLAKAEHDRDRYKTEIERLKRIVEYKVKQAEVQNDKRRD